MNTENIYQVPDDFPRCSRPGAVPGAQSKFLASKFQGRYYAPGCTPPELFERWQYCEDLAEQFSQKSLASKQGKRAHMTEQEILQQYLDRLLETDWATKEEFVWIIRRTGAILGWP